MNANKQKEKLTLLKKSQRSNFKQKKQMPFKLSEFLERFMTDAFVVTLTQLEKTGSTGKVLIPMEI